MKTRFMKLVTVMAMILSFIGFSFAQKPANPTFTPNGGEVEADAAITIAGPDGATIFCAFATEKTGEGVVYEEYNAASKPTVTADHLTIWAYARTGAEEADYAYSDTVKATYTIKAVATLTLTPKLMNGTEELTLEEPTEYIKQWVGLNVPSTAVLKLTCSDEDATILYSVDGTEPSESYTEAGIELADVLAAANQDVAAQIKAKATKGEAEVTIEIELYPEPAAVPFIVAAVLTDAVGDPVEWTENGNPGEIEGMEQWPAALWGNGTGVYLCESIVDGYMLTIMPMGNGVIYYTTDGSEPTDKSTLWEEDLELVFPAGKDSLIVKTLSIQLDEATDQPTSTTAKASFVFTKLKLGLTPTLADAHGPLDLTYDNGKYTAKQVDTTGATLALICSDPDAKITYTLNGATTEQTYTEALKLVDLFGDNNAVNITAKASKSGVDTTIIIELKARELTAEPTLAYVYWNMPYEATPEDWTADEKGFYKSTIYPSVGEVETALLFECSPKKVGNTVKVHYAFGKAATAADTTMKMDFFSGNFKLNLAFAEGKDTIELHVLVAEYAKEEPAAKADAPAPVGTLTMKFKFAKNANALILNAAVFDRAGFMIPQET